MKKSSQMSESVELGIILAVAGGFMDAYSYMCRGEVFANAQTGNMLLLGVHLSEGEWGIALSYLFPVLAFIVGIVIADGVRFKLQDKNLLHWRQLAVLFEALVLVLVSFFSQKLNLPANSLTSLACGIQVESFRKIRGSGIATTMCVGNLRSATQSFYEYCSSGDKKAAKQSLLYFGIIVCFIIGAVIGNAMVKLFAEKSILICSGILLLAFLMMFVDREKEKR